MSQDIQFILYHLSDEDGKVQVIIRDETLWCTQKAMAQLFGIDKSGISRHIANIFKEEELQQDTTVAIFATVVNRGIRGEVEELVDFYNLDAIPNMPLLLPEKSQKRQYRVDRLLISGGESVFPKPLCQEVAVEAFALFRDF